MTKNIVSSCALCIALGLPACSDISDLGVIESVGTDQVQRVTAKASKPELVQGEMISITYNYDTLPKPALLSGLALQLHWSSEYLEFSEIHDSLTKGLIGIDELQVDTNDLDDDSTTDRYIVIGWADFPVGAWPKTDTWPQPLFSADFVAKRSGDSPVNLTASATAMNYAFQGRSIIVTVN